jgi:glycosyltransferase involved in cell wall biosynthesis
MHDRFLDDALKGVLCQVTNFKFEILISDDASPDNTRSVLEKYLSSSNQNIDIKYFRHSENKGAISNFEWTLNRCTGKYIAICEGDDYWTDPFKLQRQVDFLENNKDYVLSFHNRTIRDYDGELIRNNSLPNSIKRDLNFEDLAQGIFTIPTQTVVFRNCIKKFPNNFSMVLNGDTFLYLLLSKKGKFFFDKEINGAVYRIHDGGVWSSIKYEKKLIESKKTYEILYNHFGKDDLLCKSLLNRRYGLITFYLKNKKMKSFSQELINTISFVLKKPILFVDFLSKSAKYIFKISKIKVKNTVNKSQY